MAVDWADQLSLADARSLGYVGDAAGLEGWFKNLTKTVSKVLGGAAPIVGAAAAVIPGLQPIGAGILAASTVANVAQAVAEGKVTPEQGQQVVQQAQQAAPPPPPPAPVAQASQTAPATGGGLLDNSGLLLGLVALAFLVTRRG